ncbi:VOC family protein [Pseudonocardia xinjiangensis]|uniref:VOC family protein n=1 Tax=Pseudonocardia xinjiangensis TaxID=75289 RepID=A0ABX1RFZ2_9PSEU|nr:VOC family protein [Pseudonocardia xinjiangensis]NMH79302.1 VOC family protein [Pseudonocardia xinjiangensis]
MDYRLEVAVLPVGDVDRALAFYTEQVGFTLDVDYRPSDDFRVVQLTPLGSHCSIQIVAGRTDARADPDRSMYLVVTDIDAARRDLLERGVDVGDVRHKSPIDGWQGGWQPGVDPQRGDYASFVDFADPDGNTWVLQERGFHVRG